MMDRKSRTSVIKNNIADIVKNPEKIWLGAKKLFWQTPAEILVGASLICALSGGITYMFCSSKTPLAFSEITQIKRDAQYAGIEVPAATSYLAGLNDINMKIFERSNLANSGGKLSLRKFAFELEVEMDPALTHHHHPLYLLLKTVPEDAKKFKDELKEFDEARNEIQPVAQTFEKSWKVKRQDYDKPVVKTRTYTDSDGNTHTETYVEYEYDYSIYFHTYFNDIGERASKNLDEFLKKHPELKYGKVIRTASQTNAEGEWAAEVSRDKNARLDKITLERIASTWKIGSTFNGNLSVIGQYLRELKKDANVWRQTKDKVKPQYKTRKETTSWPGPPEYLMCQQAKDDGLEMQKSINEIFAGIGLAENQLPLLEADTREIIAVELDRKKGNSKQIYNRMMDRCKKVYAANFKKGFDVSDKKTYIVGLMLVLGAFAGGLLGLGVDRAAEKYGWWDPETHTAENAFSRYRKYKQHY
ncbi:MAG: hypothetical protein Q7J54_06040 [Candidatus Woesearchaeota archaeon]|nr:hypothetical protein [Candidatus Woesearchaeota archaeon]